MTEDGDSPERTDGADVGGDADAPYKIVFEGKGCIGTGRCAEVSSNWDLDLEKGIATPETYFVEEEDLDHNLEAAAVCPAKKGDGVIHVVDRASGEELDPVEHGHGETGD